MTEENVETARRFTAALVRGDYEAAAEEVHPQLEIDDTDIPESTGKDSFYEWIGRWDAAFDNWTIEDLDVRAVGEDRTIILFTIYATGKVSGIELSRGDGAVADFRDGKMVRIAYYNDQALALKAAGLSE